MQATFVGTGDAFSRRYGQTNALVEAGPIRLMIDFGSLTVEGETTTFKDEFAYGATFGLDVPFGQGSAAFSASARYMIAGAETDEPDSDTLDLDPLVVLFGLGYRF